MSGTSKPTRFWLLPALLAALVCAGCASLAEDVATDLTTHAVGAIDQDLTAVAETVAEGAIDHELTAVVETAAERAIDQDLTATAETAVEEAIDQELTAVAETMTETASAVAARKLGLDVLEIDPVLLAGQGDDLAQITVGKRINDRLAVAYSAVLDGDEESSVELRWRAREHLELRSAREATGSYAFEARYFQELGDPAALRLEFGGGVDDEQGPRLALAVTHRSPRGRGNALSFNALAGKDELEAALVFLMPRLRDGQDDLLLSLTGHEEELPGLAESRWGLGVQLTHRFAKLGHTKAQLPGALPDRRAGHGARLPPRLPRPARRGDRQARRR